MDKEIKVLMLEDMPSDVQLIQYELNRTKKKYVYHVVETEDDYVKALEEFRPDIILSDYSLPAFDGSSAFILAKNTCPEVPFVFVSGEIEEDLAIDAMKLGVKDYVFKNRLKRLAPAVSRALAEAEEKKRRMVMENQVSLLASIVESSEDAIISMDLNGHINSWNKGAIDLYGYTAEEMIDKTFAVVIPPDYPDEIMSYIDKIKGGEKISHYEAQRVRKDGQRIEVSVTISPIRNSDNELIGVSSIVRDITERKRTEHALENLNKTLENRVKEEVSKNREKDILLIKQSRMVAMGELIRNISHYWRQPLNAVGIIIQNLKYTFQMGNLNKEYIDNIIGKTMDILQQLSQSIDNFRFFNRSDDEKCSFDVKENIEKTVFFLEASFKNEFIELETRLEDGIKVFSYPNDFSNALIHILNNAKDVLLERGVARPKIVVILAQKDGKVAVTVSDNAGGIKPEILDKIFEPYFSTRENGTGLGLYMAKIMVEQNIGGRLTAENGEEGAVFGIEFS